MTASMHLYEIFIRAPRERVWQALVDPEMTIEYFHRTRIESSFRPGEKYRYVIAADDRDAVEGVIETCEPPHRLVMSFTASLYSRPRTHAGQSVSRGSIDCTRRV